MDGRRWRDQWAAKVHTPEDLVNFVDVVGLSLIHIWWDYNNQRGFLRFYLHLTDHQRKLIFTEDGLDPHQLNPDPVSYTHSRCV